MRGCMDADSFGVQAMFCNLMQIDLNLYLNTSSLASSQVSAA